MAYGGGYLVKPVQSKMGSVADLYLQGQAQVQQIRKEVRDERAQQSKVLGKATNFVATGIQDMDKYWAGMGNQARTSLAELHEMNKRGEISRADVIAGTQALTSEMEMMGQIPTLTKSRIDELQKKIDKGAESQLTLDTYTATWFKDANATLTGLTVYDPKTGQKRNLQSFYKTEIIDNKAFMTNTFQYVDGQDEKGNDIIKTASISKPVRDHFNPNQITIKKVDDKKAVAAWAKNLGDKNFIYTDANGQEQVVGYQNMQRTTNGTNILGRISNPADVDNISKVLETEVNGKSDEFYLSYAYDVLGARAPFHSGGGKSLTKDKWESRFPSSVYFDYDPNTKKGTPLTFTKDPLTMEFDSAVNSSLSEETLKLVKSHYRNQLIAAIDVDSDVYKDRNYKSGTKKVEDDFDFAAATTYLKGEVKPKTGTLFLGQLQIAAEVYNKIASAGKLDKEGNPLYVKDISLMKSTLSNTGVTGSKVTLPGSLSELGDVDKYPLHKQGSVSLGGGIMKELASSLKVSTFTNAKFENINGFYTAEDKDGNIKVILTGNANYGTVDTKESGGSKGSEITVKGQRSYVDIGFSDDIGDATQDLYNELYKNPKWKKYFNKLNYGANDPRHKLALHEASLSLNKEMQSKISKSPNP